MNKKMLIVEKDQGLLEVLEIIFQENNIDVLKSQGWLLLSEVAYIQPEIILIDYLLDGNLGSNLCLL